MASNLTCGMAVTRLLESYGVDTVFGIPGVHTLELYKGLGGSRIRHIQARHEQGAGFMADGYARVSGRPGVCYLITGPGVTNAATPMGQAYSDSVPMLVISSANATHDLGMGRGRLHEITDQSDVTAPLTAFSKMAMSPAEVPNLIAEAFARFRNGRPRPVHISLPLDVLLEPADYEGAARAASPPPTPSTEVIDAAVEFIRRAARPIIIAGGGTVDCGPALAAFAEATGAAVALTVAAKGVLTHDHPLCLGASLERSPTQALIGEADLVIAIGTELSETDSWSDRLPINGALIRIDIDSANLQRDYGADVALLGDAGRALAAMTERLSGHAPSKAYTDGRIPALRASMATPRTALQGKHIKVLDALREALPENGVVCSDMTQIAYTGIHHFPCSQARSWFHPSGFGTLGWALPAAIGAKLAAPERPVAALVGDGGFLFTAPEIGVAVEHGLPVVVVLWNNDGLGQIRDDMIEKGMAEVGVNPTNPDYIKLAEAFGCRAVRPDGLDSFKTALREAFEADGPTLIEMRQDAPFLDE